MTTASWADRLTAAMQTKRSAVVVGIDPSIDQLPAGIRDAAAAAHGATNRGAALALYDFGRLLVDAAAEAAVAVKPQSAFFELYGSAGVAAYWDVVQYARSKGLLVIADVKRGDIGSTANAYALAYLGSPEPMAQWLDPAQQVDCITVNAYTGSEGIAPYLAALPRGKGILILVKTSNPSSGETADAPLAAGGTYADRMAGLVETWGQPHLGVCGYSSVGAVVGAPYPADLVRLRSLMPHAIILVPGYGAQGGGPADVVGAFHPGGLGAVVSASRSVMYAYQQSFGPGATAAQVVQATAAAAEAMRVAINTALGAALPPVR